MKFFDIVGLSKRTISGIFILKIFFGLMVWAVYTFYYTDRATADIYKYFDDSRVIYDSLKTNPSDYFKLLFGIGNNTPAFDHYYSEMNYWARKVDSSIYNDSHTIIRFNSFVRLFSFGYYNVHTVFMCFISLIGLTAIYKTFVIHLQDKKLELMAAVFLLPSVLFWGSGVLKEGLIFFALGLLIYYSTKIFNIKTIIGFMLTALLLALSKFYIWISILPGLILIFWTKANNSKVFLKFLIIIATVGTIGLNIESFTSIQNPMITLSQKQFEFKQLAYGKLTDANNKPIPAAKSLIEINNLEPTFLSFIENGPQALINTFLRPYFWEINSPLILLAGLETYLFLFILILTIIFSKPLKEIRWEYVLFTFSFVIIQFLIIGETTPVLGAIVRYKTTALPFLMIGLLFILDKDKLLKKIPYLKKILN